MLPDIDPDKAHPRIAVADCETDPFKKGRDTINPFLWGFFDGEEYREFATTQAFVGFIREFDGVLYAHNGGKFDWHFILPHLDPMQPLGIINGRLSRFMIGKCELRDSFNILPVSLATWEKDKIDYDIFEEGLRDIPENRAEIRKYLESDCRYLFDMVTQFIARHGFHLTQAGAAMKTWEGMTGITPPQSTPEYYDFFHPFYYGGRVQCFQRGVRDVPFQVADINSAYPRAMLETHPLGTSYGAMRNLTVAQARAWIDKRGAGMVFVRCTARSRGAFPYRAEDGALYFPDDNVPRDYHVTGWEFLAGVDTGTVDILAIPTIYVFHQGTTFREYITHFYETRLKAKEVGDKAGDLFSKLLMNSLYGKFASNPRAYANYLNLPQALTAMIGQPACTDTGVDLSAWGFSGLMGPWALAAKPLENAELRFYNIATAASITGYVRAFLWRTLCNTVNPIYCDTDSIAAEGFGEGVEFGKELGQWKHEGTFDRFAVGGRKLYAFRHATGEEAGQYKTASKGVRLTAAEIEEVAAGGVVTFEPINPTFSIHHPPRIVKRRVRAVAKTMPTSEKEGKKNKTKKC